MAQDRGIASHSNKTSKQLSIISANVRGFQTNLGDLTHSFVIPKNPDIVATVETFLNETVPENYGMITGYSKCIAETEQQEILVVLQSASARDCMFSPLMLIYQAI